MARKTSIYTISDEGRDFGKSFLLTEMPASKAEKWAARAALAMIKENIELPKDFEKMGMAALASFGISFLGKIPFVTAESLMDEMFRCVQILPNPNDRNVVRDLIDDDIEEVKTRIKLRKVIWSLHVGFSKAAAQSTTAPASAVAGSTASSNT
jgi:hypothetical protein